MDVISVLVQKKVISNTTFEGNTMIIIEVWQTILANKMIIHKSSELMVYEYKTIQLCLLPIRNDLISALSKNFV